ncbi:hypothetical protein GH714_030179 [Hevea brasiliensis]|uniref:Nudix hydrolase domain-containing protein n=1 Tax=Hevea brasiliensis TaxID=3981 RepID=A0A6A6K7J7_HEVBR|nr:hypothetical protein GH714_030179 [Hevea brasiliensis]
MSMVREGKAGVWIKLPIEFSNLVNPVVQEGFRYHHAEPDYLMLVLVVQENSGRFKGTGVWKLPTGAVNEGEDICEAAVREFKEETGIEAEFVKILAFR